MLALRRKKGESIVINNDITIVVVEIRGDKVLLGVEADRNIPVHRGEVQAAIDLHNRGTEAAANAPAVPATEGLSNKPGSPVMNRTVKKSLTVQADDQGTCKEVLQVQGAGESGWEN